MKLTVWLTLAVLLAGMGNLQAQDKRADYSDERLRLRAEWMALDMAERYDLDEKQVKELTEANLTWLKQRGDMPRMSRYDGRRDYRPRRRSHHRGGCCGSSRRADYCCDAWCEDGRHAVDCPYYDDAHRPFSQEELEERKKAFEERKEARATYEQSLRKILTEDQYKAYQERRRR